MVIVFEISIWCGENVIVVRVGFSLIIFGLKVRVVRKIRSYRVKGENGVIYNLYLVNGSLNFRIKRWVKVGNVLIFVWFGIRFFDGSGVKK